MFEVRVALVDLALLKMTSLSGYPFLRTKNCETKV